MMHLVHHHKIDCDIWMRPVDAAGRKNKQPLMQFPKITKNNKNKCAFAMDMHEAVAWNENDGHSMSVRARARALLGRQTTKHSGKSLIKCPTKFDMYTNEIVAHWQCRRSTQQKTNEFSAHKEEKAQHHSVCIFIYTVIILWHQTHACTELYLTNPFPHCNGRTSV